MSAGDAEICAATTADAEAIRVLLEQARLPFSDLAQSRPALVVARVDGALAGVGGLESHGATGLLRSVAVVPDRRGSGLGRAIVEHLERQAGDEGLDALVLLTETASEFFQRLGYRVIGREQAPASVQASAEFRSLCPASATCLIKALPRR